MDATDSAPDFEATDVVGDFEEPDFDEPDFAADAANVEEHLGAEVTEAPAKPAPPYKFIDMADLRRRIIEKHHFSVSDDDPVLMIATLHDVFLEQHEKLIQKHHKAARDMTLASVTRLDSRFETHLKQFKEEVVSANLKDNVTMIVEHKKAMERHRKMIFILTAVTCGFFLLNLVLGTAMTMALRG